MATDAIVDSAAAGRSTKPRAGAGFRIPGVRYTFLAIEWILLTGAVWAWVVIHRVWPDLHYVSPHIQWAIGSLLLAAIGTVVVLLGTRSICSGQTLMGKQGIAVANYAGMSLVGLLLVVAVRSAVWKPIEITIPAAEPSAAAGRPSVGPLPVGDPAKGQAIFVQTCATCHGANGQGVANNAPSLRDSEFIKTADPAAIAAVIRNGRTTSDPANRSGKVMPARGGNPFLDEAGIAHLVAFLKNLENTPAGSAAPADAAPPATLNRWVLRPPPAPQGLQDDVSPERLLGAGWDVEVSRRRYMRAMDWATAVVAAVLAFHWSWVVVLGCGVIFSWALELTPPQIRRLVLELRLYWIWGVTATVVWSLLFLSPGSFTGS